jgi:D-threo-aldose 1-dehydrogenase
VSVSVLGFGGAPIGNLFRPTAPDVAAATVDEAWVHGIRYFDTAPHYGLGLSERRLGDALSGRSRSEYVISTKVGRLLVPNDAPTGSDLTAGGFAVADDLRRELDFSADGVRRSLDASLARLDVDRVDIVFVHDPDDHVEQTINETIPALVDLREQGVIGAIGVGMNQWQAPLRILSESDLDVIMIAGRWTLLDQSALPLLDACGERQVAVMAAAPYNSGLLSHDWPADGAYFDYKVASAEMLAKARRLAQDCADCGTTLPVAALQFPSRHPAVTSVVVGLCTPAQVASTTERLATAIPTELWAHISRP